MGRIAGAAAIWAAGMLVAAGAGAQDVNITPEMPFFDFEVKGRYHVIEREQDQEAVVDPFWARTSRPCPPFCIHPMRAAEGVETVGELELMEFISSHVVPGRGLLIDSRLSNWYDAGTIPGAVNLPFNVFTPSATNPFLDPVLRRLGGRLLSNGRWDFSEALDLLMFCNGPWCDQSPQAIRNLIDLGYPPEKLRYYRGGMQMWRLLGLTVEVPGAAVGG